jgi:hypothetical protein
MHCPICERFKEDDEVCCQQCDESLNYHDTFQLLHLSRQTAALEAIAETLGTIQLAMFQQHGAARNT